MLVDGFVAATWQFEQGRVVLEPFGKLDAETNRALKEQSERLEAFAASPHPAVSAWFARSLSC